MGNDRGNKERTRTSSVGPFWLKIGRRKARVMPSLKPFRVEL